MKMIPQTMTYLLALLLLMPLSTLAQTNYNLTLGSSLTASNDNASWVSPSGDFAFGFQQIGSENGFLLAIWFNKIPEKTIIWSANGAQLALKGSKVVLTSDGRFMLNDPDGQLIWNPSSVLTGVSYAAMLDTGNFVLASRDSSILWGSFAQPTDTIVPGQTMSLGTKLVARLADTNYSTGRFQFNLQDDGNLVMYTTNIPLDSLNTKYWETNTEGSGHQVMYNQTGYIYLVSKNGTILNITTTSPSSTRDFYQRAILEYDGVFRQYVYPKAGVPSPATWSPGWSQLLPFIPSDICTAIRGSTGGGACGFNSYCRLVDDQRPSCECPPGYSFLDPKNTMSGCIQNFAPQSCVNGGLIEADKFTFMDMPNTDWPLSDYDYFRPVSEDWCRRACLGDCFCAVAIFRDGNCWKKKTPLSNGMIDPSVGGKALIKLRKDNSTGYLVEPPPKKKDQSTLIIVGSVLLGCSIFVNLLLLLGTIFVVLGFNKKKRSPLQPYPITPGMNLRNFTYEELEKATDGFKEELGRGAFATVYKGAVIHETGNSVAVKKLAKVAGEEDKEFKAEVSAIGRTNHKNLVQLLGFCNDGQHRMLVYELMTNGSLSEYLFAKNSRPNWYKRVQMACGTARGLLYLHEECSTQIIHCDIKPQNILLDESHDVRISDFGLAKLLRTDQTRTMTGIRGTKGYVAPEWFKNMPITAKVDVYSFGIVLLELICCRKNFDSEEKDESRMVLSDWAYNCYLDNKLDLLVENDEEALDSIKSVEKFVKIAVWCIQEEPSMRPTMKKVTQMLEGAVEVSSPPDPCSFISSI